jgi:hypothetical protein
MKVSFFFSPREQSNLCCLIRFFAQEVWLNSKGGGSNPGTSADLMN